VRYTILFLACLTLCAGCRKPATAHVSALSTTVGGRTVDAFISGPGFIHSENGSVLVTTAAHKIAIGRELVTIDGKELVKLSPETKEVQLWLNVDGYFTMNADGRGVATQQLSK
jgi:hypothetical protein